jgi:dTMP kinase
LFIVLEGIEGSGKTTAARRLAADLETAGHDVVATREPGGSAIGERIRSLLLDDRIAIRAETEALLFAAARAQHVRDVILPTLERGGIVVCDRFVDSSLAYQWGGRGLSRSAVHAAQALATHGLAPDLKILLDIPVDVGLARRAGDAGQMNRIDEESRAFHERVRSAYHALVAEDPAHWRVIDAALPPESVHEAVWAAVAPAIARRFRSIDSGDAALPGAR